MIQLYIYIYECCAMLSHSVMSDSLWIHPWTIPARLLCPWDSPGKNTGVGCHALLQGIFLTQGSNLGLPHCRWILYHLSHQGNLWILEWVAYLFSREYSQPRNWTRISALQELSCIAGAQLHCSSSLQLSYQGSPYIRIYVFFLQILFQYRLL